MIKELVNFTESIADLKNLGLKPREGLYVMLKLNIDDGHIQLDVSKREVTAFTKKMDISDSSFLKKCAIVVQNTWMVSPNKCFDSTAKAIHSCSPYCIAFKREQLNTAPISIIDKRVKVFEDKLIADYISELAKKEDIEDKKAQIKIEKYKNETAPKKAQEFKKGLQDAGKKFKENAGKNKSQIYDRLNAYFEKAFPLLNDTEGGEKGRIEVFRNAFNSEEKLNDFLLSIDEYGDTVDTDYVVIFLDESEKINTFHQRYLEDKVFNTNDFNYDKKDENGEIIDTYGTSNFFNMYPTKKPFLTHKTAVFDISNRISLKDAMTLSDFQNIINKSPKVLPNPLPIFIYDDEKEAALPILQQNALNEPEKRIGYREMIQDVYDKVKKEIGNYYLISIS
jgi:CRISPR-associated protein Csh1